MTWALVAALGLGIALHLLALAWLLRMQDSIENELDKPIEDEVE